MKALATIGTGPMAPVLSQALPSFRSYAEAHGYDLVIGSGESRGRPPSWGKVLLIRKLLDSYESVLWLDSDMLILDDSSDLESQVPTGCFQACVQIEGPGGELAPNLGTWLLRASDQSKAFLDLVWHNSHWVNSQGMWENLAVLDLMGFTTDRPYRKALPTEWDAGTHYLETDWNRLVTSLEAENGTRFAHFSAMPDAKRVHLMRLASLRQNAASRSGLGHAIVTSEFAVRRLQFSFYARKRAAADRKQYLADRSET